MVILYLYSELVGYQIPIFLEYTIKYHAQVHVVHWDKNNLKPYIPPELSNVSYYKRSEYTKNTLTQLAIDINPNIIYISGWMDRDYLSVVRKFRKKSVPVVTAFDDQWKGTLRQRLASVLFPLVRKIYYSHAWVSGPLQYEFAKRLGFKNHEIIFNMLSCNTKLFSVAIKYLKLKELDYPKSFLYVGNFRHVKGTDILIEAFQKYRLKYNGNWHLICVGNGEMHSLLEGVPNVEILGFSNQEELLEITRRAGVFVLPSRHDQWGVVVHEFASSAMPLILSENVGAKSVFLIHGFNGISYGKNSSDNLAKAMHIMSNKSNEELVTMSKNSYTLSTNITPEISAANFLSIVRK